jgi:5-methylcytosine-specific restriction protein A
MNKSSTLRSSLKRRSRDYEVEFNVTLNEVREMLYVAYGQPCKYCKTQMNVSNMVCDHTSPISAGGPSIISNLQMICKTCNIKKGPMTGKDFKRYIAWVNKQPAYMTKYINRKLAAKEVFK